LKSRGLRSSSRVIDGTFHARRDDWIASAKFAGKMRELGIRGPGREADGGGGLTVQASVRGYVLAGGASSRLVRIRRLLNSKGQTMLARNGEVAFGRSFPM